MPLTFIYTDSGGGLQALTVDASVSERHSTRVKVTDHPVEQGANVSDHATVQPDALQIEGQFVDYPLADAGRGEFDYANALRPIEGDGRAEQLYETLKALETTVTLLEVHTGGGTYPNMLLENLQRVRDKTIRGAVKFTGELRAMRIVSSAVVPIKKSTTPSGQGKATGGKQTGNQPTAAQQQQVRSLAVQALQGVGWLK